MRRDSGVTESVWTDVPDLPARPRLTKNVRTEICVIGGGMSGLTTAYLLGREGKDVVVIDDGPIAGGETARTTAHLTHVVDDRYNWIEGIHGPEGARIVAESHTVAIDRIESIARMEDIECGFERLDAYLFVPPGDPLDELEHEIAAARRAGLRGVEWVGRAPLEAFDTGRCLRFPNQAQIHPLRYLSGLARAIERDGGRIHRDTHAHAFESGETARVVLDGGAVITADHVVVATNAPIHSRFKIHTKQAPYRTYVIAAPVPPGAVAKALYYDTPWPYHYVRLHQPAPGHGDELLIVGGEDHKTGQANDALDRWSALEIWMRERFPMAGDVVHRWSGQVFEPVDGVAYIGRDADEPHTLIATGDSGMGMTHGTIAGILLTDLILGRDNPWAPLYAPGRKSLRTAREYAEENLNVAAQYLGYVTGGDVDS